MAFPENQQQDTGSNEFADNGTASHEWSALALETGKDADLFLGSVKVINGKTYMMDEERSMFCQVYIDDVRRRAIGGMLFVEYKIDLTEFLGEDQGGTADVVIYLPKTKHLIVEDLKYGTGEKVYAQTSGEINPQLGLYLLGCIKDIMLLGHQIETVEGIICQPRLGHIDTTEPMSIADLLYFGEAAKLAVKHVGIALTQSADGLDAYLTPGEKQCRWCRAKATCPALTRFVADEVKADFDELPVLPTQPKTLARAYSAVPLIRDWCSAVEAELTKQVAEGIEVIGPDNKPFKFVEGREGSRKWSDEKAAEVALLGVLGPKAYTEPKLLTAPAAGKLLDKKATKQTWKDVFEPMIVRPRGQPVLVAGSDPRPPVSGTATAEDFAVKTGAES